MLEILYVAAFPIRFISTSENRSGWAHIRVRLSDLHSGDPEDDRTEWPTKANISSQDLQLPLWILSLSVGKNARQPNHDAINSQILLAQCLFSHLIERKYEERGGRLWGGPWELPACQPSLHKGTRVPWPSSMILFYSHINLTSYL